MYSVKEVSIQCREKEHRLVELQFFADLLDVIFEWIEKDRDSAICKFCDTDFVGTDGENGQSIRQRANLLQLLPRLGKVEKQDL